MRRARFNHPSHGAALSHVVVMIAQKNTRTTSPFSRERRRRGKEEYRQRKRSSRRLSRAVMRGALLFLFLV